MVQLRVDSGDSVQRKFKLFFPLMASGPDGGGNGIEPDLRVWNHKPRNQKGERDTTGRQSGNGFLRQPRQRYPTLIGIARLVDDPERNRNLWKAQYAAFFPGGPEGNDFTLTQFIPHRIEIMQLSSSGANLALDNGTGDTNPRERVLDRPGASLLTIHVWLPARHVL